MYKVCEEAVEVGLETHVYNFCEMSVVNVRKYPEHLFVDRLTRIVKVWWESSFFAYPGTGLTTGARGTRRASRREDS